jgi:hypothetical protein
MAAEDFRDEPSEAADSFGRRNKKDLHSGDRFAFSYSRLPVQMSRSTACVPN